MQQKEMVDYLFSKYNKMIFSRKEASRILGISTSNLDRKRKNGSIKTLQENDEGSVYFPIQELARYLTNVEFNIIHKEQKA